MTLEDELSGLVESPEAILENALEPDLDVKRRYFTSFTSHIPWRRECYALSKPSARAQSTVLRSVSRGSV